MSGLRSHLGEPERGTAVQLGDYIAQGLRQLIGMSDYGKYLEHMRSRHPQRAVMSYEAFVAERAKARYRRGPLNRCC
jgi:uncharacterized short protein YbdD (DUF466 family)